MWSQIHHFLTEENYTLRILREISHHRPMSNAELRENREI